MKKNLNLSILLIVAMILYALCGLFINQHGGNLYLSWLFWNLFLAVLPVFFAFGVQMIPKWNIVSIFLSSLWILFLPNACYMVTDLIYLNSSSFIGPDGSYLQHLYAWIELFYIASGVFLAMVCGLFSTHLMTQKLQFKTSISHMIWLMIISLLCGYGVYIGRFLRLNSWDVLHPRSLLLKLFENMNSFTLLFTIMTAVFYFIAALIFEAMMNNKTPNDQ